MLNKKFIHSKLILMVAIVIFFVTKISLTFAKAQLFEADGDVVMGNIGIENVEIAYEKAKEKALRSASEQALLLSQCLK